ncbi:MULTISPECIES: ABC transporter permease [unclassified Curtobacterium]|uniref:ABC transporter permease n=1 Tax=unclassified Curtobacterium TaxID=257496 RepID=UPI000DAA03A5|nr:MULTISPECIES: ABC transporter permease [unclassified Curtobacterium]PZE25352.1 ABC transporter permease [Curtobacterium sp. MCBD17_028]PZE75376.1 ABC transporter permease [Curtobacterium sp. MCBD17_019]PZF57990.1 ABC transporter permease [Curtobacterium sp. MCBD17_034]PZF61410.1 ABC transporter permease [Curtobacterium sp. MCBD17_013]PZM33358.1 ABC transporter permease [Curtobacterium sp. MCBD17_031]
MSTLQGGAPLEPNISDGFDDAASGQEHEPGESQGRIILRRFLGNKLAVISLVVYVLVILFSISAIGLGPIPGWWHYSYKALNPLVGGGAPSSDHPFGQDRIGKDYFALTMRGIQNSVLVMIVIGVFATFIGVVVGAVAGYFRGKTDAILMRITDIFIVIPAIVIGAVVGKTANGLGAWGLALLLGLVSWMVIARLVRAEFLSLREREFVEAARVAGASDIRIIFRHILPNAIGVIIVSATLLIATAILLETALSYLGYGIKAPDSSLGLLISQNQSAFQTRPYLFWWPASFIVLLALCVNFVGDGLRDAFDPRSKRFSIRRTKERELHNSSESEMISA